MILNLFTWLSNALSGNPAIALAASFIWGILSIILSPCHLASIPLIVGFIDDQGNVQTKRAFFLSFLFALGILITIVFIGVATSVMGRMVGDIGRWGNYFVSGIFFIVGLYLLGLIPFSFSGSGPVGMKRKGFVASFILGLVFGIGLGPCTFAYLAPVVGVAFSLAKTNLVFAVTLLLMYGIGHCIVIIFAGTFTGVVQQYLNWNESSKGALVLKKVCGILVILGGVYLILSIK